ncbi:carboxymuconolactone decarboxylase family protein [Dysgonomonas termitidis]|jgi:AhpD family alkylhydroperoxidase|uniref:Carboxymuconolactone decarboxylase family protein n=1 Tax=Dysgonomonas termitidis TaxID=1516126 RepID=A0ABV9KPY6_9BACT
MRVNISELEPKAYRAMLMLESFLNASDLNPIHKELIKIRASQINGCAFCLNMHTKDARKLGETEQRIYMLNAWREAYELYSEEEKVILAMTEEITLINKGGLSDETYNKAISLFSGNVVAQLIMAIVTINAWNRIGISTELRPEY